MLLTTQELRAKRRHAYELVARLTVACGEALAIMQGRVGALFVDAARAKYPRHVAFRAQLDRACRDSPLLPTPPRRR